jgi:superfamily I DNA/RNA helicase
MKAGDDLGNLLKKLGEYKDREVSKLVRAGKEKKADALIDKVETVHALADGIESVRGLEHRIESIFSDDKAGVVCSSVHRAKGLESERVTVYKPSLMPWPKTAPGTWQYEQEINLKYVALTRAKVELRMVEGK